MQLVVARAPAELGQLMRESHQAKTRLIATSDAALVAAQERGLTAEPIQAFASLDEWPSLVMDAAYDVSRNWWRAADLDDISAQLEEHRGVELWRLLELPVYHVVSEAAYALLLAERLLEELGPEEVVVCRRKPPVGGFWVGFSLDLRAEAVALVASEHGVPVRRLKQPPPRPSDIARGTYRRALHIRNALQSRHGHASPENSTPADVLVHAEGRHLWPLLPVLRELQSVSAAVIEDDVDDAGRRAVRALGLPLVGVAPGSSSIRLMPVAERLGTVEFRDHRLAGLIGFQLDWLLRHGVNEIDRRLDAAERLLNVVRPRLLFTAVDTSFKDLSLILPARRQGIPVLTQLHGALPRRPRATQWSLPKADVLATWGTLNRQSLASVLGWPDERLPLVGYPHFAELAARGRELDRKALRSSLEIAPEDRVALFLVSMTGGALAPSFGSGVVIYDELFSAVKGAAFDVVIVRLHPASNPAVVDRIGARHRVRTIVNPALDLAQTVTAADVVVSQPTTALLESMILGQPTVFFTAQTAPEELLWVERGRLIHAADAPQLARVLRELVESPQARRRAFALQEEFLALAADPRDGNAARRTADLVRSLLAGARPTTVTRTAD